MYARGTSEQVLWWNPFRPLDTEADARRAARRGVWPAALLLLLTIAGFLGRLAFGRITATPAGLTVLGVGVAWFALLGVLCWRIWRHYGFWSNVAMAVLVGLYVLGRVAAIALGGSGAGAFFLLMLAGASIFGLRGSWRLRQLRRAGSPADPSVFD